MQKRIDKLSIIIEKNLNEASVLCGKLKGNCDHPKTTYRLIKSDGSNILDYMSICDYCGASAV